MYYDKNDPVRVHKYLSILKINIEMASNISFFDNK